jgi:hypothetical protein
MDIKEIDNVPEFECDIDPVTLSKLSEGDKLMAVSFSKLRQEIRWIGEKTVIAHNMSIQIHATFIALLKWGGASIGVIIVEEVVRRFIISA